jgi:hypothetical protein
MKTYSRFANFSVIKSFMRYEFPCLTLDQSTKTTMENACFSLMKTLCTCLFTLTAITFGNWVPKIRMRRLNTFVCPRKIGREVRF